MKIAGSQAKAVLSELIRKAEQGEEVHLTRYGETQAIIVGRDQYDRYRRSLMTGK